MTERRDLREEREFFPDDLTDLIDLRERLIAAGQPPAVASGITAWVLVKQSGRPDGLTAPTRSRYRRILRELVEFEPAGPDNDRRIAAESEGASVRSIAHNLRYVK